MTTAVRAVAPRPKATPTAGTQLHHDRARTSGPSSLRTPSWWSGCGSATAASTRTPARAASRPPSVSSPGCSARTRCWSSCCSCRGSVARARPRVRPPRGLAPLDRVRGRLVARGHTVFITLGYAASNRQSFVGSDARLRRTTIPTCSWRSSGWRSSSRSRSPRSRSPARRMRRETWYLVHLYAYLAVALGFAHQLAVGNDFSSDRHRARVVGLPLRARARRDRRVARRLAAVVQRPPPPARPPRRPRGAGRRLHLHDRHAPRPGSEPRRASSSCGGSSPATGGGRLTRSRSRPRPRPTPAHHREGSRRRHRPVQRLRPGVRCVRRRPIRHLHRRAAHATAGVL